MSKFIILRTKIGDCRTAVRIDTITAVVEKDGTVWVRTNEEDAFEVVGETLDSILDQIDPDSGPLDLAYDAEEYGL